MWVEDEDSVNLNLICQQLNKYQNWKTELFIIAFSQSNLLSFLKENGSPFDEDRNEVKRQIRIGLFTHLIILIIIIGLVFGALYQLDFLVKIITGTALIIGYLAMSIKYSLNLFIPASNKIKTSTDNN